MNELKEEEKKKFIDAFASDSKPVLIRSTFELPHKQQSEIKHSIKEILGAKTNFEFKITPELVSGIELTSNGFKLSWSISEYLSSLQKSISEIIKEKSKVETEKKVDLENVLDLKKKIEPEQNVDLKKKIEQEKKPELEKKVESEKKTELEKK